MPAAKRASLSALMLAKNAARTSTFAGWQANREELAWAAGFFDGEGHAGNPKVKSKPSGRLQISIAQNDRRVLDRFHRAVGLGRVNGPYQYNERVSQKPYYLYSASAHVGYQHVMACLWPWLSPVKRAQMSNALTEHRELTWK